MDDARRGEGGAGPFPAKGALKNALFFEREMVHKCTRILSTAEWKKVPKRYQSSTILQQETKWSSRKM
jgi:hypothetical protein